MVELVKQRPEGSFIYSMTTKVYFGRDMIGNLGAELAKLGKRVLLCYGGGSIKRTGLYGRVVTEVRSSGLELFELPGIEPNPRVTSVREGAEICRKEDIDVVLAVGGGSVIDCSKFVAAAACYDGDAWDLLKEKVTLERCLPVVTVLTLSATGSEMNASGVISNLDSCDKIGMAYSKMLPKVSFLDPTATFSVGKYQTACGSADILSHIIESYFVPKNESMYMFDRFKEGMMKTVIKYAPIAIAEPENYEARENLMWTSSWAITKFARAKQLCDWSCHSMEHQLSAIYDIAHGHGLAILTPRWMKYILGPDTLFRFVMYGVNVFGIDSSLPDMEIAERAIEETEDFLFNKLGLEPRLRDIGIGDDKIELMARKASRGEVVPAFKPLSQSDMEAIYRMCL
jgi:alcohol dehydrogenase YqhD (iron-dependent ADH family)